MTFKKRKGSAKMEQLALEFETVMEVVNVYQEVKERPAGYEIAINSSTQAGEIGIKEIGKSVSEQLLVVVINTKNEINAIHKVFAGSLNSSIAHPRDIFRTAIMNNGSRIIVYHNHPSGRVLSRVNYKRII